MAASFLRTVCVLLALGGAAGAQDMFSPVIVVNDRAVTGYELDQRIRLLTAFNTPGDLAEVARTQLVEERLKAQELERVGVSLSEEGLTRALSDFAARADLTSDEFIAQLAGEGIAYETLRDYIKTNFTWRDYIRARYGDRVEISDEEVERALVQEATEAEGIEVLLSEIIIPAPPAEAARAESIARQISQITSTAEFEAAAREVSAVRSREVGGRLDWQPLSNFPAALRGIILDLAPGEVTPPLPVTGAVALLQLRDIREGAVPAVEPESVDYAIVRIPGGLSPDALAQASRLASQVNTCTDLFGQGLPDQNIARETVAPGALPQALALELATLDPGETTWGRTESSGATLLFTMLCARNYALPEGVADKDSVRNVLESRQLEAYSQSLIADLRASAVIQGE